MKTKSNFRDDSITMKHLKDLTYEMFMQDHSNIQSYPYLSYINNTEFTKAINLNILEIHESSIVTQGFTLDEQWKPTYIVFRTKHNRRKVKVIDALITSEMAILYVDKDTRNWSYTKGCELCCDRQMFYIGDGIICKIKSSPSSQRTIYFQHDSFLDDL